MTTVNHKNLCLFQPHYALVDPLVYQRFISGSTRQWLTCASQCMHSRWTSCTAHLWHHLRSPLQREPVFLVISVFLVVTYVGPSETSAPTMVLFILHTTRGICLCLWTRSINSAVLLILLCCTSNTNNLSYIRRSVMNSITVVFISYASSTPIFIPLMLPSKSSLLWPLWWTNHYK